MAWGTVTIGGVEFREEVNASETSRGLQIVGQDSHPPQLLAAVEAADRNVVAMQGLIVPVVFSDKGHLTGFYKVVDSESNLEWRFQGRHAVATWGITLERVGAGRDVEVESRLTLVARPDDIPGTQTAVFWHAPAVGHTSYYTGTSSPAFVDRPGEDGIVRVYTGLTNDAPRWTIRADDYVRGGARITFDTFRRLGELTPSAALWEITNGLVKVAPGTGGALVVSCYDNSIYRSPTTWAFTVNGTPLGVQPELTIMRNEPEEVVVRLTYPTTPGRVVVDLSLRRGARFVTGVIKRQSSATLGVTSSAAAPVSAVTGGVRRTTADADGNRYVAGTARNATIDTVNGALSLASVLRFDFFFGHEIESAPAGDLYADLLNQYLGSGGEKVRVVRR